MAQSVSTDRLPRRVATVTPDPTLAAEHSARVAAFQIAMTARADVADPDADPATPDSATGRNNLTRYLSMPRVGSSRMFDTVRDTDADADPDGDDVPPQWTVHLAIDTADLAAALAIGHVIAQLVDLAVPAVDVGLTSVSVDDEDRRHRVYCDRRLTGGGRCGLLTGHTPGCLARGFAPVAHTDPAVMAAQTAMEGFARTDLDRYQARRILAMWAHYAALSPAQVDLILAAYPAPHPDRHDLHWES